MKGERESRSQNLEFGIQKPGDGSHRRYRRHAGNAGLPDGMRIAEFRAVGVPGDTGVIPATGLPIYLVYLGACSESLIVIFSKAF
jgi:hypothetical protein